LWKENDLKIIKETHEAQNKKHKEIIASGLKNLEELFKKIKEEKVNFDKVKQENLKEKESIFQEMKQLKEV